MVARRQFRESGSLTDRCIDHWAEVNVLQIMLYLTTSISNRVFLGEVDCHDQQWVNAAFSYLANFNRTMMVMRSLPLWLRPIGATLLPASWRLQANFRAAKVSLTPMINRRKAARQMPSKEKPDDFLQWMVDAANESDSRPESLARRLLLVMVGSSRTTMMAGAHALYDLVAMPEYLEPLRAEVCGLSREGREWNRSVCINMEKMDSFLKESQRFSPVALRKLVINVDSLRRSTNVHQSIFLASLKFLLLLPTAPTFLLVPSFAQLPTTSPRIAVLLPMLIPSMAFATMRSVRCPKKLKEICSSRPIRTIIILDMADMPVRDASSQVMFSR